MQVPACRAARMWPPRPTRAPAHDRADSFSRLPQLPLYCGGLTTSSPWLEVGAVDRSRQSPFSGGPAEHLVQACEYATCGFGARGGRVAGKRLPTRPVPGLAAPPGPSSGARCGLPADGAARLHSRANTRFSRPRARLNRSSPHRSGDCSDMHFCSVSCTITAFCAVATHRDYGKLHRFCSCQRCQMCTNRLGTRPPARHRE